MKTPLLFLTASLAAFAAPPEPKFTAQDIDKAVKIGYGVAIADVDGDKLTDILLADARQIRWYKNPGKRGAEWPRHVIAEELTKSDNVCIAAQDIDGDGKCEVAIGAEWNPGDTEKSGAVFYLIPPADRTQKWEPVKFPSVEPTTHRMKWVRLGEKDWGLVVLPLHGRGNKNGEGAGVKVLLYRKPADVKAEWKSEVLDDSMHATHNFDVPAWLNFSVATTPPMFAAGIVAAGREGILGISGVGGTRWTKAYFVRNDSVPAASERDQLSDPNFKGSGEIRAGVLGQGKEDGGYFAAVEPMHGNQLAIYVIVPDKRMSRTVLTDKLNQGHALGCGDLLGVGGDQIVVGWRGAKPGDKVGIAVWTALDDTGEKWRETLVDDNGTACEDLALADLDGDGKLDIIAAGRATHNLRILWNER